MGQLKIDFPLIIISDEGYLKYCSESAGELLFIPNINGLVGQKIDAHQHCSSDFSKEVIELVEKARTDQTPYNSELRKGDMVFLVSVAPVVEGKKPSGISVILNNITEYRTKETESALLYHISSTMSSTLPPKEISEKILWQIVQVMNLSGGNIMLVDPPSQILFVETTTSPNRMRPLRLKLGQGIAGWVAKTGQPLAIPHTKKEKRYVLASKNEDKSLLSVPLITKGQILGVLNLWKPAGEYFAESQVQTFSIIASRIADVIETNRQRIVGEKRLELAQILNSTPDLQPIVEKAIVKVTEILGNVPCSIYTWTDLNYLDSLASTHHCYVGGRKHEMRMSSAKVKHLIDETGSPILLNNWKNSGWVKSLMHKHGEGWNNTIASGLISKGELFGLLFIHYAAATELGRDTLNLISAISSQLAMTLENSQLYTDVARERDILETIHRTTGEGLILLDVRGEIIFYNQAVKELLGMKKDILGEGLDSILSEPDKYCRYMFIPQIDMSDSIRRSATEGRAFTMTLNTCEKPFRVIKGRLEPIKDQHSGGALLTLRNFTEIEDLNNKMATRVEQLTDLFKISNLTGASHLKTIDRVIKYLPKLLQAEGSVFLQITDGELIPLARSNWRTYNKLILADSKIAQLSVTKKRPQVIKSGEIDKNDQVLPRKTDSILTVPLVEGGACTGIIAVRNKLQGKRFNKDDVKLISIAGDKVQSLMKSLKLMGNIGREKDRLSVLIESSAEGIFAVDNDGSISLWNEAMSRLTGYSTEEAMGKAANKFLLTGRDNLGLIDLINSSRKMNQQKGSLYEIELHTKSRNKRWVGIHFAIPLSNREGETEMIILLNDISRYKELEQKKNEFISMTAHELRTPLTAIKGYMSMIIQGDAGPLNEKQDRYFGRVYSSVERLVGLVEDLLNVVRIEEKRMVFNIKPAPLQNLAKEVMFDFKQKALQKGIALDFKTNNQLKNVLVLMDSDRTKQILSNLVDNAIKYTHRNGKISIKLYKDGKGKYVVTEVEDNGVGIPPSQIENVFDKNYRVNNPLSNQAGGYGLGLYITRSLVEQQNGEIWVKSAEGRGSIFSFSVPINNK